MLRPITLALHPYVHILSMCAVTMSRAGQGLSALDIEPAPMLSGVRSTQGGGRRLTPLLVLVCLLLAEGCLAPASWKKGRLRKLLILLSNPPPSPKPTQSKGHPMYVLEHFAYSLLHATKPSTKFDVATNVFHSPEAAYGHITDYMEYRSRWDNDGFNTYVKFRLTCPDGIVETFQFDFQPDFRTYVLGEHTVDGEVVSVPC